MERLIPSGMTREDRRKDPIPFPQFDHSRLLSKIIAKDNGCWGSIIAKRNDGYYSFSIGGRLFLAHRLVYGIFSGYKYSNSLIDHICHNRSCLNPDHLREVDPRTNSLENSESPKLKQFKQTHCKHGHKFTPENTYILRMGVYGGVLRNCRECEKNRVVRRRLARLSKKNG